MPGSTVNAAAELISSTWPLRFAISGSAACAVSIVPIRLTSIVRASACAETGHHRGQRRDAGVGDDDVEPAEGVHGPLHGGLQRLGVGDVGLHPQVLGAELVGDRAPARSGSRPTSATRAPRAAALRASSAPMPRAAPVISTDLPARDVRGRCLRKAIVGSSDPGARIERCSEPL